MHISVLKDETIDSLDIKRGDIIVDGTLGGGGHTLEIVKRFTDKVKIIGLDLDEEAKERVENLFSNISCDLTIINEGFQDLDKVLDNLGIKFIDKVILDLGLSSFQLDDSSRGFSFKRNEPLLMTMKKNISDLDLSAYDIVNTWGEETLANIIYGFGEEKYSRKIAKAIVSARSLKEIQTTFDLVDIIEKAIGRHYRNLKIHPATRTFQALRIATNSELTNLEKGIEVCFERLNINGRIAVITFHSLEDRIVKNYFNKKKNDGLANLINKKPILPGQEEIINNPRSRSAKLRVIEKI